MTLNHLYNKNKQPHDKERIDESQKTIVLIWRKFINHHYQSIYLDRVILITQYNYTSNTKSFYPWEGKTI